MALKLDEIINKKKEPSHILDLSKVKIKNKEEFEKYYDKIPEFKIRPEKIRPEDSKIREETSFVQTRKETRNRLKREFVFGNPVPESMRSVRLEDLAAVDINWRMLTVCRPKTRVEEDLFSRLVELSKLKLSTKKYEAKVLANASAGLPSNQAELINLGITITKTKRGTMETRIKTCRECHEDMCNGKYCKDFPYDSYTRMIMDKDDLAKDDAAEIGASDSKRRTSTKSKKGISAKKIFSGKSKAKSNSHKKNRKTKSKSKRKSAKPKVIEEDEGIVVAVDTFEKIDSEPLKA